MWSMKHTLLTAGGGAIAAAALLGGVAMAQTPTPSTPPTPSSPAPTTPADPNAPAQSPAPRQRGGDDCPEKGGSQASRGTQGAGTSTGLRF